MASSSNNSNNNLSFDRDLRHAFAALSVRLESGIKSLDGVIELLRLRIEAEAQFASSLERIISNKSLICNIPTIETLRRDGLDALYTDLKNEYQQHIEYLNSLNEDIYLPCISMRELYASKNRLFANNTKQNIKSLRQHQNQFYKIKTKYEKVCKDASNARTLLLNAKLDNKISSQQILKLGTKVNSTLKTQQIWKEKYDQQQLIWNKQQIKFDDEMTSILQGMQTNEQNRMEIIKDSLNKFAVFITNLCANRNYDCKNLAQSMSQINIDNDLQIFIKNTLKQYPPKQPQHTPPYHSLHFGKIQQNAISNLNKISSTSINSNGSNKSNKSNKLNKSNKSHQRKQSSSSQSNSFFTTSITTTTNHTRQSSNSLSLSFEPAVINGRNHHLNGNSPQIIRTQSTPNSIGSFFKQKFQKQRSYNSPNTKPISSSSYNNANMRRNERSEYSKSNTISSFTKHSSIDNDDVININVMDNDQDPEIPSIEININNNSNNNNNNNNNDQRMKLTKIKYPKPVSPVPKPPKNRHNSDNRS